MKRTTLRLKSEDAGRVQALREHLHVDGEKLSANDMITLLVRRGCASLEKELGMKPDGKQVSS